MRLTGFTTLTFDCYGTLIDWETGILAVLRPWAVRNGLDASDDALLEAFGRHENRVQGNNPAMPYPDILRRTQHAVAADLGAAAAAADADALATSIKDWPAFPDSTAALAYLKQHYRLVILSNIDRASFAHSNA
ncbi:MAG: haloacid dehalogenase, partial [Alphaproteobacteria bacterium]